jgi:hypothetical protein
MVANPEWRDSGIGAEGLGCSGEAETKSGQERSEPEVAVSKKAAGND